MYDGEWLSVQWNWCSITPWVSQSNRSACRVLALLVNNHNRIIVVSGYILMYVRRVHTCMQTNTCVPVLYDT